MADRLSSTVDKLVEQCVSCLLAQDDDPQKNCQHVSSARITPRLSNPVVLLNAPVITDEGLFSFKEITLDEARGLVVRHGFESAIGHALTAAVLSELLEVDCPLRRIEFRQVPGQMALVFRLARRLEEGQVLSDRADIESIGFSFALLTREE